MNHITDTRAYTDGTIEANDAADAAAKLDELLEDGKLTADGQAIACAGRGLIYAVLAARSAIADAVQDVGGAVSDLDHAPGLLDLAQSIDNLAAGTSPAADSQPLACTLDWVPDWATCTTERGGGSWAIHPAAADIPAECLPREYGRHVGAGTLADWISARLGSRVVMFPRHRLTAGGWRIWVTPVWHVYLDGR